VYQPYSPIESTLAVHRTLVEVELGRNHPEHRFRYREVGRPGPLAAVRRVAARALVALGTRLDPSAGLPAPAASGLRA
jgi:hypothetical protein